MGQYRNVTDARNREVALLQEERARLEAAENELSAFITDSNETAQAFVSHTVIAEEDEGDNKMHETSRFSPD